MIYQVIVPSEETVEHAGGGKKEVVRRKLFPGYVFVQMDMGDNPDEPNEAWEVVRNTPGVTGFVGTATRAVPLTQEEEMRMLGTMGAYRYERNAQSQGQLRRREHRAGLLRGRSPILPASFPNSIRSAAKSRYSYLFSGVKHPVELDFSQVIKN